jgi:hypothetical protein
VPASTSLAAAATSTVCVAVESLVLGPPAKKLLPPSIAVETSVPGNPLAP